MRRSWRDHWKPGTHEREAFDDLERLIKNRISKQFPVGSLYVTLDSRNPAETLGEGVWELIIVTGGE